MAKDKSQKEKQTQVFLENTFSKESYTWEM